MRKPARWCGRNRADFNPATLHNWPQYAIFRQDMERMREAYRLQPDSVEGSENRELPEE